MRFEFATAMRIVFGEGAAHEIGQLAAELGRRALVVGWSSQEWIEPHLKILFDHGLECTYYPIHAEPTVEVVRSGSGLARQENCDLVIGFGGGSVLDASKAIAILTANEGDIYDYLEVIGRGKAFTKPAIPLITLPTTAGTGAEVTRNAVIGVPEQRVKVSLRSNYMVARLALVDPELTYGMPPEITASTGMDALTQLIEPFVSNKANPLTDALCLDGIARAARSLLRVYRDCEDTAARQDMALASLFSGLALANAKLGAVHGFASVLGGMYSGPHGAICARLLPPVMVINVCALKERGMSQQYLQKYETLARILTGREDAAPEDGVAWIQELGEALHIPPLSAYGVNPADFPEIVAKSAVASSTKGNPIELTPAELEEVLKRAL
jgi:alcohol dehydrogenase class IV